MTFDPNEARDQSGKWTAGAGNGAHAEGPFMAVSDAANAEKADKVARIAAQVAKKLGFDPKGINISDESKTFELNGKMLNYAGLATRPADPHLRTDPDGSKHVIGGGIGTVTLFTPHVGDDPAAIAGVTAHEIAHQKFNALLSDKNVDYLKMPYDPDYGKDPKWIPYDPANPTHAAMKENGAMVSSPQEDGVVKIREPGFMRPDGTLNEPYASKYPGYQAYTKAMMPMISDFAKSDGVTDYSKEYWLGYQTPKDVEYVKNTDTGEKGTYSTTSVPAESAFHETLAEIERLKYAKEDIYHRKLGEVDGKPVYFRTSKKGLKPEWSKLYKAMNENWKRRNEND
jgi:hypothetical protein